MAKPANEQALTTIARRCQRFLLTTCIAVLLYTLSAGPVLKLISHKRLPRRAALLYTPLTVIHSVPLLDDVWGWYVYELWRLPAVPIPDSYVENP